MLVHLVTHPRPDATGLPRPALRGLSDSLRRAGVDVVEDVGDFPGVDLQADVAACAEQLTTRWGRERPEVVLAIGLVAASAAVQAGRSLPTGPSVPVVAVFDEYPVDRARERGLAQHVAAVLPMSKREDDHWHRLDVRTLTAGVFPAAVLLPDADVGATPSGWVVTLAAGPLLDAFVEALPGWDCAGLVIGAALPPARWASLRRRAAALGVGDRLRHRPAPASRRRGTLWADAALLVASPEEARHGWGVLEAASWGIPTIAVARDAYVDHVVHGTTGLLVPPDARTLTAAVGELLADGFRLRGMGLAARDRMRWVHEPSRSGPRLARLLGQVATDGVAGAAVGPEGPTEEERTAAEPRELRSVDRAVRDALVIEHLPLARQLAQWYAGRGQAPEDLDQVARLGLVLAASRYDPAHGTPFPSFAVPTILGELRRHFRDHAWAMRVPRSLQEDVLAVRRAEDELAVQQGHEASAAEIAARVQLSEGAVAEAVFAARSARTVDSLDQPLGDDGCWLDRCGALDPHLALAEVRPDVRAIVRRLPEREQRALLLRFYGDLTQCEIAQRLGISQVQVSRILARALSAIRDHVNQDAALPAAWTDGRPRPEAGRHRGPRTVRAS